MISDIKKMYLDESHIPGIIYLAIYKSPNLLKITFLFIFGNLQFLLAKQIAEQNKIY